MLTTIKTSQSGVTNLVLPMVSFLCIYGWAILHGSLAVLAAPGIVSSSWRVCARSHRKHPLIRSMAETQCDSVLCRASDACQCGTRAFGFSDKHRHRVSRYAVPRSLQRTDFHSLCKLRCTIKWQTLMILPTRPCTRTNYWGSSRPPPSLSKIRQNLSKYTYVLTPLQPDLQCAGFVQFHADIFLG